MPKPFKFKPTKHEPKCSSNGTRAEQGDAALSAWLEKSGSGFDPSNVTDLIADLGHMCDRDELDFEAAIESALINWRAER